MTTAFAAARPAAAADRPSLVIDLDGLAASVAADGLSAHEHEVGAVARRAHVKGVALVAAEVLADRSQPTVARLRAFGLVARALTEATSVQVVTSARVTAATRRRPSTSTSAAAMLTTAVAAQAAS